MGTLTPGTVALVTGAASGIGRAIALCLARSGARVAAVDLHLPGVEEAAALIQAAGAQALAVQADVSSQAAGAAVTSRVLDCWSRLDILVNNAGVSGESPFLDMDEAEWDRVLDFNLKGAFLCAQAAARAMVRAGQGGKIVNVTSVNAEVAGPGLAHYCASKGGLRMLTRVMALELAPHKINVNAVAPGIVDTPLTRGSLADPDRRRALLAHVPWGRVGQPEDVAHAVLFLASPEADFITGATLLVDGGWLVQ
jgi:NAD(P)-dependent dehydrogenase (short-subunit alcohol dehydrogenase family)